MLGGTASSKLLKVLMYLMSLCVEPCTSVLQTNKSACHLEMIKVDEEYEYIEEGDIMIGGVLTIGLSIGVDDREMTVRCIRPSVQKYRYLVEFLFLVKEINDNPEILPNMTLGYHIHDSCGDSQRAVRSIFKTLSGSRDPIPNYSCVGKRKITGFIGDLHSDSTMSMANILGVLGYSQISYGATDPSLSDRATFPYFFRTVQSDEEEYIALCKVLKYFGWNWVGIMQSDDYSGYRDHQLLMKHLSREGICVEFSVKIMSKSTDQPWTIAIKSLTDVIIICGRLNLANSHYLTRGTYTLGKKTYIYLSKILNDFEELLFNEQMLIDSLTFMQNSLNYLFDPTFGDFSNSMHPSQYPEEKLLENIWIRYLCCLSKNISKPNVRDSVESRIPRHCSGKEKLMDIPHYLGLYHSGSLIQAMDMMTSALEDMQGFLSKQMPEKHRRRDNYNYQLHHFLKNNPYKGDNSPVSYKLEIGNPQRQTKGNKWNWKTVGYYVPWAPLEQTLNAEKIKWKTPNNKVPRASCSESCVPGYRKVLAPGVRSCCYKCIPCRDREISNITDSETCIRCPDFEWPNEKKNQCIARTEEFLSYTNDMISVSVSSFSVLFFLFTVLILGVFVTYRDTPIVRANNRSLSFLLLVSIKLSFLSVFLFLGRPVDITCMLRNITFGITFSIAVSSLLAKTIMVCVAFKATKPGSSWRKWVGAKLSYSVVLFCSSIQIIICMTWLAISPPFQELDLHTYPGTIIIQCNEGSAIGFYSVIGYMGLLAAVSFVLAFLARTLPDSFNEAKYITFSMLLFCSVWITMIPAYLSTKGKNTVCVEIFAILTSSAGLLACIFLPKCYTIMFRAKMNSKTNLLKNKS
ncbi:hypothetical protein XELAEV_18004315mg [Xenopus laevis]|uniref:G-protein coupled receptors family 3 profile domain-containing protein n=1 Tax=Xenopus laevis TaxID=8355 RepID=A0A974BRC6_XENLA|nr:hypothetical protein XELAEV_18004315mg [Xenopus laevis]